MQQSKHEIIMMECPKAMAVRMLRREVDSGHIRERKSTSLREWLDVLYKGLIYWLGSVPFIDMGQGHRRTYGWKEKDENL